MILDGQGDRLADVEEVAGEEGNEDPSRSGFEVLGDQGSQTIIGGGIALAGRVKGLRHKEQSRLFGDAAKGPGIEKERGRAVIFDHEVIDVDDVPFIRGDGDSAAVGDVVGGVEEVDPALCDHERGGRGDGHEFEFRDVFPYVPSEIQEHFLGDLGAIDRGRGLIVDI